MGVKGSSKQRACASGTYPKVNLTDLRQAPTGDLLAEHRSALEAALGVPASDGNQVDILQNGAEIFPAMLRAIALARERVDLLTYVYWDGATARDFAAALSSKARQGVSVNLLIDAFGSKNVDDATIAGMRESGVVVRWFRPLARWRFWLNDNRTHRKILVVDNRIGFTGGVGIADEWSGDAEGPSNWRETHFRFAGPAVAGLKAAFLDNWNEAGDWEWDHVPDQTQPAPGGVPVQIVQAASTIGWTATASLLRALVTIARHSLHIVTPYFVPDRTLRDMLSAKSTRGVDVRLMYPGEHCDMRLPQLAGYPSVGPLLKSGVEVWEYQKTMLHSKIIVVDNLLACVGSANFNHRSLGKDEECCAVIYSPTVATELVAQFDADCAHAEPVTLRTWHERSRLVRLQERLARLIVNEL